VQRRAFVQLALLAAVIAGATTAIAVLIPWMPVSASKERDRIDLTYWLATGIAIFIFSIVAAAILYSVWRFRAHPDDDSDGPPIHGHTGLEIVWTAIPTALVTTIAIVSAIVLHDNGTIPKNALRVNVTAQQFTWTFTYTDGPAKGVTSPNLYLPIGRSTILEITSVDVLHSFWVPQFGQKQDAVPDRVNPLKITPTRIGTYPVICTELCGLGHAIMRREAIVLSANDFTAKKWAAGLPGATPAPPSGGAPAPSGGAAGKAVFRELPQAHGVERDRHRRSRSRQAPRLRQAGRPAAPGLHSRVDREPERLHPIRVPGRRDAPELRPDDLQA